MTRALPALLLASCAFYPTAREEADARWREARLELAGGGSCPRALALLDRAVELDPDRPDFYETRASLRRDLGRPEGAVADFSAALDLRTRSGGVTEEIAALYLARGSLNGDLGLVPDAEKDFERALELQPDLVEARLQRARVRQRAGKTELAAQDLDEARKQGKSSHGPLHNEGIRHLKDGRYDLAERYFTFAAEIGPDRAETQVALGRVHLETRRFAEAAAAFGRAAALQPKDAGHYYYRGTALLALGRPQEALADFSRAQELAPSRATYVTARAIIFHEHFRDPVRAEAEYSGAMRLDPQDPSPVFNRGLLYQETGRFEEAEKDFRHALALRASPEAALRLAATLRERKQHWTAVEVCIRALEIADDAQRKSLEEERRRNMDALRTPETSK